MSSDLPIKTSKPGKTSATIKSGGTIDSIYSFAGKGSETNLVMAGAIAKNHGGSPADWSHKRGFSMVSYSDCSEAYAEIHWFDNDYIGQYGYKIKLQIKEDK